MDTYGAFAPSESEVASYKEKLDNSKAEQKNLFLIIFQVSFFSRNYFQSKDSIEIKILTYFLSNLKLSIHVKKIKKKLMENSKN